jgi:hypothetical protein
MDLYFQRHDGQVRCIFFNITHRHIQLLIGHCRTNYIVAGSGCSREWMDLYFQCHVEQVGQRGSQSRKQLSQRVPSFKRCHPASAHLCCVTLLHLLLQAVTCDDFLAAMADANGEDLSGISASAHMCYVALFFFLQAVACDDFLAGLADATGEDLSGIQHELTCVMSRCCISCYRPLHVTISLPPWLTPMERTCQALAAGTARQAPPR